MCVPSYGRVHVGARCGVDARIAPPFMEATDASRLVCVVVVSYQEYSHTRENRNTFFGRSDRRENDESRKTAGWHEGCSENRRQTAKRDRKRQTPKGR